MHPRGARYLHSMSKMRTLYEAEEKENPRIFDIDFDI